MDPETKSVWTLVAACAAAAASIVNAVLTIWAGRQGERRRQYRELLAPHVVEFAEHLHQIGASAQIIVKRLQLGQDTGNYLQRCKDACSGLDTLRRKLKYPLWEICEGIRVLTRLGGWLRHRLNRVEDADRLVGQAEELRLALDLAVKGAFLRGRPPGLRSRWRCTRAARRLRDEWERTSPQAEQPFEEELQDLEQALE